MSFQFPVSGSQKKQKQSHEGHKGLTKGDSLLLILWHLFIDFFCPGEDAAGEVADFGESGGAKDGTSVCTALTGAAMDDIIFVWIEVIDAVAQLAERDEWSAEIAD